MYKNIAIVILLIIICALLVQDFREGREIKFLCRSIRDIASFNKAYITKHNLDWNDYLSSVEKSKSVKTNCMDLERYYHFCQSCPPLEMLSDGSIPESASMIIDPAREESPTTENSPDSSEKSDDVSGDEAE